MLAVAAVMASLVSFAIFELERATVSETVVLSQLADSELEPRLRALVAQAPAGLAVVVESLGAERSALRTAAFRVLHEEIDRAGTASAEDAAATLDRLTQLLATCSPHFGGDALSLAAELAERIVALPRNAARGDDNRLRDCHVVFAARAEERMRQRDRIDLRTLATDLNKADHAVGRYGKTSDEPAIDLAPLAGGGLPMIPAQSKPLRLPAQLVAEARPLRHAEREALAPATTAAAKTTEHDNMVASANPLTAVPPSQFIADDVGTVVLTADTVQTVSGVWPSSEPVRSEPAVTPPAQHTQLLDLAKRVRGNEATAVKAARDELKRLGVDERQLSLALGAVDSDPRVRKEVVEALPLVGSVDTRGWLLWLSHDRDAEVRRAAISLLATSSDPELKKRVRQAAISDSDPRVREQARAAAFGVR
ncbi:MAG: HEAT repeat domain-containing protein [Pirellulales bacterium]